eukprot:TRINITY_DN3357_c0_g3_i1.p1 TRINITY_DN3357_c0_g3~~TRINITY_DN3357_c0_g3_i1.p1  ORF type:complete len:217 (-),score=31.71 TRINITY_DN3357_c0_g3_i1:158-739(-)
MCIRDSFRDAGASTIILMKEKQTALEEEFAKYRKLVSIELKIREIIAEKLQKENDRLRSTVPGAGASKGSNVKVRGSSDGKKLRFDVPGERKRGTVMASSGVYVGHNVSEILGRVGFDNSVNNTISSVTNDNLMNMSTAAGGASNNVSIVDAGERDRGGIGPFMDKLEFMLSQCMFTQITTFIMYIQLRVGTL